MNFNKSKIKKKILFILLIFLITTCKNDVIDVIPYVQVQVTVTSGEIASLGIGSAMLKDGGYAGLIVYRVTETQFMAFERLCTYYPNDTSAVILDKSLSTATCPVCKTSYLLIDGYKINNGPARLPLRQYQCFYSNNRLTIVN
jgi:hypothetical protein